MAVAQEFIDFFVPVDLIRQKYPGGWEACLSDHASLIGGRVWYDDHIFRDGAMGPADIAALVEQWKGRGFTVNRAEGGRLVEWVDVCVSERMFGGRTLPCTWIAFDPLTGGAYRAGTEPGKLIGPQR